MGIKKVDSIWLDGKLVSWDDAVDHMLAHTMHYGVGTFEGIRAYQRADGKTAIFRLREHIDRLFDSALICTMDVPFSREQIMTGCADVLRANKMASAYLRPLIYLGSGALGLGSFEPPCAVDDRGLRVGRLPGRRRHAQGHQVHGLGLHPVQRQRGHEQGQDLRSVRDLGPGQAHGAQERLRRGPHARSPGLRRRRHRREHLRREERRGPHPADLGRHPGGHHPRHRDPAPARARRRGRRGHDRPRRAVHRR
jgi:hypothetical protein